MSRSKKRNIFLTVALIGLMMIFLSPTKTFVSAAYAKADDNMTHCEYSNDANGNCLTKADYCAQNTSDTSRCSTVAAAGGATSFTNPLNYTNVEDLLTGILSAIQKIIVVLALVFIAIGAVMILVSAGSPETVEKGKKAITMAIVGLAIGIAAPSILKELAGILGWGTTNASVTAAMSLSAIALRVLNFLLGITGVLALIMLVVGAVMYLTSAGDEERIESGKKIFRNALIGVLIVMASMVLVRQIALFFVAG